MNKSISYHWFNKSHHITFNLFVGGIYNAQAKELCTTQTCANGGPKLNLDRSYIIILMSTVEIWRDKGMGDLLMLCWNSTRGSHQVNKSEYFNGFFFGRYCVGLITQNVAQRVVEGTKRGPKGGRRNLSLFLKS